MRLLHIELIFPPVYIQHNQCPCRFFLPAPRATNSVVKNYKTDTTSHLANTETRLGHETPSAMDTRAREQASTPQTNFKGKNKKKDKKEEQKQIEAASAHSRMIRLQYTMIASECECLNHMPRKTDGPLSSWPKPDSTIVIPRAAGRARSAKYLVNPRKGCSRSFQEISGRLP